MILYLNIGGIEKLMIKDIKHIKNIALNKKVCCISIVLLIYLIFFTLISYGEKIALDEKEKSMPLGYRLSVIDNWIREDYEKDAKIGFVLSLVTGGIVYLTAFNVIDLDTIVKNNKKKVKKKISKKLKQVLDEE